MPAAAVIPAPIAYINAVAVKKLVVGSRLSALGWLIGFTEFVDICVFVVCLWVLLTECPYVGYRFTLKKLECSKQASLRLNIRAWNNGIGRRFYFVGFRKST